METAVGFSNLLQKILLICGILSSLVYLSTDWLAGKLLKGYNFAVQSMSELSASGSPVRPLVVSLTCAAAALLVAFGVGVWRAAGGAVLPRIVSVLIIGNAVTGLIGTLFFPTRFGERPAFGTVGVLLMFCSVLCFVLAMIFGAFAYSGWLRILSITIPASYILLAVLRFATAGSSTAGQTVVRIGAQERTMAYSFLVWVIALAIYLLSQAGQAAGSAGSVSR